MSTPDPTDGAERPADRPRLALVMRFVALLGSIVSLSSLWLSERTRVVDDLQLSAEATARPGERLALRAFYLRDVEAPAGPTLEQADVKVRLLDAKGRQIAGTTLRRARDGETMEGELSLAESVHGDVLIEAQAQLTDRSPLKVVRPLAVFPEAPRLAPRYRASPPLQQLSIGSLRPLLPEGGDLVLEPRIVGGACVPEESCRLLVWVGGSGARVTLRHDAALTVAEVRADESAGIVAFELTVHGPEAVLALEAHRAQHLVAERTLRLPIGLGEPAMSNADSLLAQDQLVTLDVRLPPGRVRGIVDMFPAGRWSRTLAFTAQEGRALRVPLLGAGQIRIQAQTDKFGGEGAAARVVYVRRPGESDGQALAQIVQQSRAAELAGELEALPELPPALLAEPQRTAAFLLAPFELQRTPLPRAVTGRPRELQRLSRAQTGLRYGVGAALVLSALLVGMTLTRRGLSAQREADAILALASAESDDDATEPASHRNSGLGSGVAFVLSLVLVVSLAFLAAALLIVAKPLWF